MPGCLRLTKRGTLQQSASERKSFAGSRTRDLFEISTVKRCNIPHIREHIPARIKLPKSRVKLRSPATVEN